MRREIRLHVRAGRDLAARIDTAAKRDGVGRSTWIRRALAQAVRAGFRASERPGLAKGSERSEQRKAG